MCIHFLYSIKTEITIHTILIVAPDKYTNILIPHISQNNSIPMNKIEEIIKPTGMKVSELFKKSVMEFLEENYKEDDDDSE